MNFIVLISLFISVSFAEEDWSKLYSDIEENNLELQSLKQRFKAEILDLKSENQFDNIQVDGLYLLPMQESGTKYTEFQISQEVDFPLLYQVRKEHRLLIEKKLSQVYESKRKDILWEAEQHLIQLVYLHKKIDIEKERNYRAKQNVLHFEQLWELGSIDKLSLNKAKLVWLHEQFLLEELTVEREHLMVMLQELQGGKELEFSPLEYASEIILPTLDSIWTSKKEEDVHLQILAENVIIAKQELRVSKLERYPNMRLGYNVQGVSENRSSGLYFGMEIPFWRSRDTILVSTFKLKQEELLEAEILLHEELFLDVHYGDHQMLAEKYDEYLRILDQLVGEELLDESLRQGDLSFVEYYQELSFYREAIDHVLEMEWKLQESKSELLKHQL